MRKHKKKHLRSHLYPSNYLYFCQRHKTGKEIVKTLQLDSTTFLACFLVWAADCMHYLHFYFNSWYSFVAVSNNFIKEFTSGQILHLFHFYFSCQCRQERVLKSLGALLPPLLLYPLLAARVCGPAMQVSSLVTTQQAFHYLFLFISVLSSSSFS